VQPPQPKEFVTTLTEDSAIAAAPTMATAG
jgi:hypothetical protein